MSGTSAEDVYIGKPRIARDAFTDEDLEWLVDLIRNYIEPQAVNLLLNSFDSFNEAAKKGEMGKEISLYVYYKTGDKDGNPDHAGENDAMAYVSADGRKIDGKLKYCRCHCRCRRRCRCRCRRASRAADNRATCCCGGR